MAENIASWIFRSRNRINSGIKKIYILTQFNSASLHNHISNTYIFDTFSKGFVEILAAEQTIKTETWYEGTADAVRRTCATSAIRKRITIDSQRDQLYRMDLMDMLNRHIDAKAEFTIAAKPISRASGDRLGDHRL